MGKAGYSSGYSTEVGTQSPEHAKTSMLRSRIMFWGLPLRRLPYLDNTEYGVDVPRLLEFSFFRFQGKLLGSTPPGLPSETKVRVGLGLAPSRTYGADLRSIIYVERAGYSTLRV